MNTQWILCLKNLFGKNPDILPSNQKAERRPSKLIAAVTLVELQEYKNSFLAVLDCNHSD